MFMLRTRNPAGIVPWQMYCAMDDLADNYAYGSLRATTRQTFQMHGILKEDIKTVVSTIIRNMGSTMAACGDVNRNVCAPPAPYKNDPAYAYAEEYSIHLANLFAPQTRAYYDVWLDGEKWLTVEKGKTVHQSAAGAIDGKYVDKAQPLDRTSPAAESELTIRERAKNPAGANYEGHEEPIYGKQYLPRKFKIGITVPGDNSVDLFTNDLGLIVMCDAQGELQGFNVVVGGGMGRAHRNANTFPRVAEPIGYVPKDKIFQACKAIVATQRDFGDRSDRKHARMKYLVHDWGISKFRRVVEGYFGDTFEPFRALPEWKFTTYLGWHEQGDGNWFCGVPIPAGRIAGEPKRALRQIVEQHKLTTRLTANQDIILCDVTPAMKAEVDSLLVASGLRMSEQMNPLESLSIACPALPTCGLAITEAERAMPSIQERVRKVLVKLGMGDESFIMRITGCPNGCARPYMAELALVGDGPTSYQLWLGGAPGLTRVAAVFMDKMPIAKLEETLEPVFAMYKAQRGATESFGDFCSRAGFAALSQFSATYVPVPDASELAEPATVLGPKPRVSLDPVLYARLKALKDKDGRPITDLASEAVARYLVELEQGNEDANKGKVGKAA